MKKHIKILNPAAKKAMDAAMNGTAQNLAKSSADDVKKVMSREPGCGRVQ